jgi:hypothetical protein
MRMTPVISTTKPVLVARTLPFLPFAPFDLRFLTEGITVQSPGVFPQLGRMFRGEERKNVTYPADLALSARIEPFVDNEQELTGRSQKIILSFN